MVPRLTGNGASFRGAGAYYLHDKPFTNEAGDTVRPESRDRVAWTLTRNCLAETPEAAIDEMWRIAEAQSLIKQAAGLRLSGRPCDAPVKTLSLAWHPSERPTREQMIEAADGYLQHMGWQQHQALYVAHSDTAHAHVHIILNRVHPETGRTLDDFREQVRSQVWARTYEREHGRIWCEERLARDYSAANIPKREGQVPHDLEQQGRADDAAHVAATAAQDRLDRTDRELLHASQREEREAFFASAREEFRDARHAIFVATAREFRPQWQAHFATARQLELQARALGRESSARAFELAASGQYGAAWATIAGADGPDGFDPARAARDQIAASHARIAEAQKLVRSERQQTAAKDLHAERADRYLAMKERQADERAELRDIAAAADRGEPIDRARLNALLHGDRPLPTDASDLLRQLRAANDSAAPLDRGSSNDNRPPRLAADAQVIAQAQHHRDLLLASARTTRSGGMVNMQQADMAVLRRRAERAAEHKGEGREATKSPALESTADTAISERLRRIMELDTRTPEERQRGKGDPQRQARDRGGGRDR